MKKNRNTETIQMICLDLPCSVPTNGFSPNFPFELDAMLHEKIAVFPIYLGLQK